MTTDDPYHWPPELMSMLIDTIPLLCRSKDDVIGFLRGSGTPEALLTPWRQSLTTNREAVKKHAIVRSVLTAMNEQGDRGLSARRAILKRVVEFEEFSTCWPDDQLKAKGLIADVRKVINARDSFTRMRQTAEAELSARRTERQVEADRISARRVQCRSLHSKLVTLFSETNAQRRGSALEPVLNKVFAMDGLLIRESFTLRSQDGTPFEQIDGVIELDGLQYLVEMKWWADPIGTDAVARHLVRVYSRGEARGLFISASGYTEAAINDHVTALVQKVVMLADLHELVMLLERQEDIANWLREKVRFAAVERRPYVRLGVDLG